MSGPTVQTPGTTPEQDMCVVCVEPIAPGVAVADCGDGPEHPACHRDTHGEPAADGGAATAPPRQLGGAADPGGGDGDPAAAPPPPPVTITSFGYLHAPAPDAHIVLDLRHHFRDPHVSPQLRYLTARDIPVRQAVLGTPGIAELIEAVVAAVRAYLAGPSAGPVTVAVGCAGGRHRAAVVAEALAQRLGGTVGHRDLHRDVVERGKGGGA